MITTPTPTEREREAFEVIYGVKVLRPETSVVLVRGKPRIPYVGAIMDFLMHPLVWYPGWISLAIYVFTRVN